MRAALAPRRACAHLDLERRRPGVRPGEPTGAVGGAACGAGSRPSGRQPQPGERSGEDEKERRAKRWEDPEDRGERTRCAEARGDCTRRSVRLTGRRGRVQRGDSLQQAKHRVMSNATRTRTGQLGNGTEAVSRPGETRPPPPPSPPGFADSPSSRNATMLSPPARVRAHAKGMNGPEVTPQCRVPPAFPFWPGRPGRPGRTQRRSRQRPLARRPRW